MEERLFAISEGSEFGNLEAEFGSFKTALCMTVIILTAEYGSTRYGCQSCLFVLSWTGKMVSLFAPDNLVSRDKLRRPIPCQPAHSPHSVRLNRILPHGFLPISAAAAIYFYRQPPTVPSLSGHTIIIVFRWRSPPRVRRHRASNPQGSISNGYCIFRYHPGPSTAPLFSHIH